FKDLITFLPCPILTHAIARHQLQILSVKSIWHIYNQVPDFQNLTQIEIFFSNFKGRSWRDKWIWMLQMLQHSPKLQDLIIHQEMEDGICEEDNWLDPQVVPECLSSQLRTCMFRDWRGRQVPNP
ncbi:F-box/FBD/LRR protein, partial [Trifolium medium]|nr:F-box/FBD/LRR protein [Trifolium medium]